jgi:hypothetical protein
MPSPPKIDWGKAFAFYAALPPGERGYPAVAHRFPVSLTSVKKHARDEHWRERAAAIDHEAAKQAEKKVGRTRSEQIESTLKVTDAMRVSYAKQLAEGDRVRGVDLAQMLRVEALLVGEATERVELSELQDRFRLFFDQLLPLIPAEQTEEALRRIKHLIDPDS